MGCCFSTGEAPRPADSRKPSTHQDKAQPTEEEKVKEVLVHSISQNSVSKAPPEPEELVVDTQTEKVAEKNPRGSDKAPDISQTSEICDSISHSFSTATTATTCTTVEKKGEDEVSSKTKPRAQYCRRPQAASPTSKRYNGGDGVRGRASRSPAKADGSPQKRQVPAKPKLVQGRGTNQVGARKGNAGPTTVGRASGGGKDFPRRRSRSPATRSSDVMSKNGKAKSCPAKAGGQSMEEVHKERSEGEIEDGGGTESLENPLVSLECFIFL